MFWTKSMSVVPLIMLLLVAVTLAQLVGNHKNTSCLLNTGFIQKHSSSYRKMSSATFEEHTTQLWTNMYILLDATLDTETKSAFPKISRTYMLYLWSMLDSMLRTCNM